MRNPCRLDRRLDRPRGRVYGPRVAHREDARRGMGREGIRFLTVALVGVSSLGPPAQEEKLDAQALHGRDRAALLNVRTVLLAEKQRSEEHTSELQSRENLVCRL